MINQQAHEKMIKARSKLMKGQLGMASMLLHLDLVEVSADQCSTMATDGKRIIYNPQFVLDIEEIEVQSVLVHEALHVVWEHPLRRGKRHHKVWNIACDYAINGFLVYDLGLSYPKAVYGIVTTWASRARLSIVNSLPTKKHCKMLSTQ